MSISAKIFNAVITYDSLKEIYEIVTNKCNSENQITDQSLQLEIQPCLDKANIRKDIRFLPMSSPSTDCLITKCRGTNLFKEPMIFIDPNFYKADKEACKFLVKRQIGHIKNNDAFQNACISGICQIGTSILTNHEGFSLLPTILLNSLVQHTVSKSLELREEITADQFAIENSSSEELLGGRRFFIALEEACSESEKKKCSDYSKRSIRRRIRDIEKAIQIKRVEIDIEAEEKKIKDLKSCLIPYVSYQPIARKAIA